MKQKILFNFSTGYNYRYNLTHPWEILFHLWREIGDFIHRGLYGYAITDTWSLDFYLSSWMPSAIRRIKDGYGYPYGLTEEKWKEILEEIAKGFEAYYKISEHYDASAEQLMIWDKEREAGLALFSRWYGNLWD